jgi:hypothetical protein
VASEHEIIEWANGYVVTRESAISQWTTVILIERHEKQGLRIWRVWLEPFDDNEPAIRMSFGAVIVWWMWIVVNGFHALVEFPRSWAGDRMIMYGSLATAQGLFLIGQNGTMIYRLLPPEIRDSEALIG